MESGHSFHHWVVESAGSRISELADGFAISAAGGEPQAAGALCAL